MEEVSRWKNIGRGEVVGRAEYWEYWNLGFWVSTLGTDQPWRALTHSFSPFGTGRHWVNIAIVTLQGGLKEPIQY